MAYQSYIDDPRVLQSLEGQRYVVLRAPASVSAAFAGVQEALRSQLRDRPVSYIAYPHVTLCGFAAGTPLSAVQDLVADWARTAPPLRVEAVRVTTLPPPVQIVIVEVRKTPALVAALAGLRARAQAAQLPVRSFVSVEQWIFHLSVAYCGRLAADEWNELKRFAETLNLPAAADDVGAVEIAAFDQCAEYSGGVYTLAGSLDSVT